MKNQETKPCCPWPSVAPNGQQVWKELENEKDTRQASMAANIPSQIWMLLFRPEQGLFF